MRRTLSAVPVVLAALVGSACDTEDSAFPRTGTLTLQVVDRTLGGQTADEPTNQFAKWTVTMAEADVSGVGTVSFLGAQPPCDVGQRIGILGSTCRITGLALAPGSGTTATVRLTISALEVIRAQRPLLTPGGDWDQDTIPDDEDNCIYVPNTDQANENESEEGDDPVGDACTNVLGAKDSDADTVADIVDNCVYVANTQQADAARGDGFSDGVGDACEQKVAVTIPPTGLLIRRADQPLTILQQDLAILSFDFRSKDWCDHGATSCTLDPADVVLTLQ